MQSREICAHITARVIEAMERGAYAFEECVAELGSVFLTANLGLPAPIDNHAAYIADWLEVLRSDNRAIFKAAAQAQRACDWLLERIKREPETLTEKLAAIGAHSKL